jgi:hypothetical protein
MEIMVGKRPTQAQTLPPDGVVLEELIANLQEEYGTPSTPQEYRLIIRVPQQDAASEKPPPTVTDPDEAPPARKRRRRGRRRRGAQSTTGAAVEELNDETDEATQDSMLNLEEDDLDDEDEGNFEASQAPDERAFNLTDPPA